jgi:hypothetical protein
VSLIVDRDRIEEILSMRAGECGPGELACTVDTWYDPATMPDEVRWQAKFNPCSNHERVLAVLSIERPEIQDEGPCGCYDDDETGIWDKDCRYPALLKAAEAVLERVGTLKSAFPTWEVMEQNEFDTLRREVERAKSTAKEGA